MKSQRSDAWLKLIQAVVYIEADLAEALQTGHRLGLSEFRALQELARAPKSELRMQERAAKLGLNQSSVSRMTERLERTGFAIRDLCPDDKRGVYTVLTEKGRACVEGAQEDCERALDSAIKAHGSERVLPAQMLGAA